MKGVRVQAEGETEDADSKQASPVAESRAHALPRALLSPHHRRGHTRSDAPSRCLHARTSALRSGGCEDAGSGPRNPEQVTLEGLSLDSEGLPQFKWSDEATISRSEAQGDTESCCASQPCARGVTALQVQSPRSTHPERPDLTPTVLHKTHPFTHKTNDNAAKDTARGDKTCSCPRTSLCSIPAPSCSRAHPLPALYSLGTAPGPLLLLAFATTPTGHHLPSRCAAFSEISILGCRKVYLRQARRDPC